MFTLHFLKLFFVTLPWVFLLWIHLSLVMILVRVFGTLASISFFGVPFLFTWPVFLFHLDLRRRGNRWRSFGFFHQHAVCAGSVMGSFLLTCLFGWPFLLSFLCTERVFGGGWWYPMCCTGFWGQLGARTWFLFTCFLLKYHHISYLTQFNPILHKLPQFI